MTINETSEESHDCVHERELRYIEALIYSESDTGEAVCGNGLTVMFSQRKSMLAMLKIKIRVRAIRR